jgi:hypothetical protein
MSANLPAGVTDRDIDNLCAEPGDETISCAYCENFLNKHDTDTYREDCGDYYCTDSAQKCWQQHQKFRFRGALTSEIIPLVKELRDRLYLVADAHDQDDCDSVAALLAAHDWIEEEAEGRRSTFRTGVTLAQHEYTYMEIELAGLAASLESDRRVAEREDHSGWQVALRTQDCVRLGRIRQILDNSFCASRGDLPKWNVMAPDWSRLSKMGPQSYVTKAVAA